MFFFLNFLSFIFFRPLVVSLSIDFFSFSQHIFYFSPIKCFCLLAEWKILTHIHKQSERPSGEKKKVAHSKEIRFVICSFQTTKQLYRVLNFPQLRESKPQKKNMKSAFEMRNSFYFDSFANQRETDRYGVSEIESAKRNKPAFENESLHFTSHWITLNESSRLEFIGEKIEKFITLTSTRLCSIMELKILDRIIKLIHQRK